MVIVCHMQMITEVHKRPRLPLRGENCPNYKKDLELRVLGHFLTHIGMSSESASAGKFCTFEEKNPCIGSMSINRFSLGSANCQTSGFLLLLDFARKCNFVESVAKI